MAKLDILIFPNEILRTKCTPVQKVDERLHKIFEDMAETMYEAPGVGLAAPQVGLTERIMVVDVGPLLTEGEPNVGLLKIINPEIIESAGTSTFEEGCLSLPLLLEAIERPAEVTVKFQELSGQERVLKASGILATALQHEIDHLNGVLILDYLSPLKRSSYKSKLKKELKRMAENQKKKKEKT